MSAATALAACGTARIVHKTPYGGVIELQGDHNKAMEQANEEMAAQCANFIVLREGDEPVTAADPPLGTPVATVYRVHYQCGDAAPAGAPPPPRND
jgi:hypothetical protein